MQVSISFVLFATDAGYTWSRNRRTSSSQHKVGLLWVEGPIMAVSHTSFLTAGKGPVSIRTERAVSMTYLA